MKRRFSLGMFSCLFALLALSAWACLVITGCQSPDSTAKVSQLNPSQVRSVISQDLKDRANELWRAKAEKNWPVVFSYREPQTRKDESLTAFKKYCEEKEPFVVHSYSLEKTEVDGDLGWVNIEYTSTMRQYPNLPARKVKTWEKWRITDGQWYPVPTKELPFYPAPPCQRNLKAESQLLERFEKSWQERKAGNWSSVYEMCDPEDRKLIPKEEFAASMSLIKYLSREVKWVEVINNKGKILVDILHKPTDPSLTKLQPSLSTMNEKWILVDGIWYQDIQG